MYRPCLLPLTVRWLGKLKQRFGKFSQGKTDELWGAASKDARKVSAGIDSESLAIDDAFQFFRNIIHGWHLCIVDQQRHERDIALESDPRPLIRGRNCT